MKTKTIKISGKRIENDIVIELPGKRKMTIQYRNYEGDDKGCGATVDILLPDPTEVTNSLGSEMKPARAFAKNAHIRYADQLTIVL